MLLNEQFKVFVSAHYCNTEQENKITVKELGELSEKLNVPLNLEDVAKILESEAYVTFKGELIVSGQKIWLWNSREDFIKDVISYLCMNAQGFFFVYWEQNDFFQGFNVVKLEISEQILTKLEATRKRSPSRNQKRKELEYEPIWI